MQHSGHTSLLCMSIGVKCVGTMIVPSMVRVRACISQTLMCTSENSLPKEQEEQQEQQQKQAQSSNNQAETTLLYLPGLLQLRPSRRTHLQPPASGASRPLFRGVKCSGGLEALVHDRTM